MLNKFYEKLLSSFSLLLEFIRKPFQRHYNELNNDKSLIFFASFLYGISVIIQFLFAAMYGMANPNSFIIGLIISPIFGMLTIYISSPIFGFYLKYVATPLVKFPLLDYLKTKQIVTFSLIGLFVPTMGKYTIIGLLVSLLIQILGLQRLFNLELKKALITASIYYGILWSFLRLIN